MSDKIIERCCYCKSIKDIYGEYNPRIKIPTCIQHYSKLLSISDGICPKCLIKVKKDIIKNNEVIK